MTAAGDKTGEYCVASDARNSLSAMHAPLLNYWRGSSHFSEPLSPFDCGFLSSFFKRDIWGASVICVQEVDGLGMKVMERKMSSNENLRASAFDAKQMQQSIFLWVSLTADCRGRFIFSYARHYSPTFFISSLLLLSKYNTLNTEV